MDVCVEAAEIRRELERRANPRRVEFASTNYPTAEHVIGVVAKELRTVVRESSARLADAPAAQLVALARALVATGVLECRQAGYELLARHREALASLEREDLESLGEGIDNWLTVDTFAALLAGPAWREGQISDGAVRAWSASPDRWWRRAAVVCTVALNQKARGGGGDPVRTIDICERVVADRDDTVAKALSWALRELAKRDRASVAAFLERHGDELAARVRREVRHKLETGRKN